MRALVWHGKGDVRCDTVPDPIIEDPRDIIVKITSTAICGSDLHLYDHYMPAMEKGDILGHEPMGEVVELGMFHTVLLETGNWTDSGHPTGRRVTFTNNFAVEGHYFKFSTSGQWLWDELRIFLPSGQDPYPIIDAIQQKVLEATSESARKAEQEWKRSAGSRDMGAISATPALSVKPVIGGTEVSVRYIASANERSQLRAMLNHAAVDLLGAALPPKPESDRRKTHETVANG